MKITIFTCISFNSNIMIRLSQIANVTYQDENNLMNIADSFTWFYYQIAKPYLNRLPNFYLFVSIYIYLFLGKFVIHYSEFKFLLNTKISL